MNDQLWMSVVLDRLACTPVDPPRGIELCRLRPSDIAAAFPAEALPLIAVGFADRSWDEQAVSQRVLDRRTLRCLLTAREGQRLVGLTTVHSTAQRPVARLHWLAVAESHRRAGVGTALVLAAGEEAVIEGFSEMTLKTEAYRVAAIELYRRLGFTIAASG